MNKRDAIHFRKRITSDTLCGFFLSRPGDSFTTTTSEEMVTCQDCKDRLAPTPKAKG